MKKYVIKINIYDCANCKSIVAHEISTESETNAHDSIDKWIQNVSTKYNMQDWKKEIFPNGEMFSSSNSDSINAVALLRFEN